MDKQKLEDYYFERNSTIFSEMLDEDENYQRLKKAKLAAEKALQNVISKEACKNWFGHRKTWNDFLREKRTPSKKRRPDKRIPPRTLPILGRCPRRLF